VFARDDHRCKVPGCRSARNLEVHHIIEQSKGGTHELSNLCLLCSGHHAALHEGLLTIRGRAPYDIQFQWMYGAPIPPGLQADVRQSIITQRVQEILNRTLYAREDQPVARAAESQPGPMGRVDPDPVWATRRSKRVQPGPPSRIEPSSTPNRPAESNPVPDGTDKQN